MNAYGKNTLRIFIQATVPDSGEADQSAIDSLTGS